MGRDLLAQDYILKQLTASLMYPENELGQRFWKRVHAKAAEKFGTTQIPMNAYHKIWIVPDRAAVYENESGAFVVNSRLKVMLAEDYVAMQNAAGRVNYAGAQSDNSEQNTLVSQIIREVLVPEIEKEVNEGQTFANLRQVYHSMILASWFKNNLKESLLGQVYVDREKTSGVDVDDPQVKEKIYQQYLQAFKKGVYNYIKEEYDQVSQEVIPRQYFSGGAGFQKIDNAVLVETYDDISIRQAPADVIRGVEEIAANPNLIVVEVALYEADRDGKNATAIARAIENTRADFAMKAEEKFEELTRAMAPFDRSYIAGLYGKFVALQEAAQAGKETPGLIIGKNFKPSALLSDLERRELLGARDFASDIFGKSEYVAAAHDVVLISNPMNGGLGSSVSRKSYLERLTGRTELGAKGTDLFFKVEINGFDSQGKKMTVLEQVSVTELKYIQALRSAKNYTNIIMQELVNEDSIGPMNRFLDETIYIEDRVDQRPGAPRRTYRQIIEETEGIELATAMIEQGSLPVIDVATNELTDDYTAPGGHGQLGSMVLQEALTAELIEGKIVIRTVFNGDGPNNNISKSIAGFMAKENVPIVMISTTKTPLDKKGGLIGLETTENGSVRAQMVELAQAKANGQEKIFTAMGLTEGQAGAQFFNTNVAAVNYTALQPFLRELKDIIGEAKFNEIVTPDLIENEKTKTGGRKVLQLEGAMGSALLNLNGFVTTTDNDQVQRLMNKYGFKRLLTIVNVDQENRTRFFTPIKFAYDHILYSETDHFHVSATSGLLVNQGVDHLPGFATMDDYYKDVQNGIDAFRGASMLGLDELHVLGQVNMPGAVLVGRVAINSKVAGVLDLNKFVREIGRTAQGKLLLDNVYIEVDKSGNLALIRPIDEIDLEARLSAKDSAVLANVVTEPGILEWTTGRFRQATAKAPTQTLEQVLGQIIKEYDIRGYDGFGNPDTNPQQYDEELLTWIGRTMATVEFESAVHRGKRVKLEPGDSFVIAGDNGPSTQWVKDNLIAGLREAGINVIDLGGSKEGEQTVISGQLYKSISTLGAKGGLYVTRSHVEIGTNGMKPNIGGITLYGDMLTAIKEQILKGEYLQAEAPGSLDTAVETRRKSRQAYYKSLRDEYQGLRDAISTAGLKVALNFNGGSSVDYRDIAEELVGNENITRIIRDKSDPLNENGGLADPSRDDDTALAHPKENVIQYSKDHPDEFIISFDLDTDRVSIVVDGELYLGDRMFYPIVEHLLTLDEYKDIHKTQPIWVDSRMRKEVGLLARFFGGIAKKHPKGHSKVKATMDMQLLELAESKGYDTIQAFLADYPGYKDVQAEYSLHMFKTDQKGQAFDDALDFGLYWLQVYTQLIAEHRKAGNEWAQTGRFDAYIDHLVSIGAFQISEQLKEQRTPSTDDAKTKVMIAMKDAVVDYFAGSDNFSYDAEWRTAEGDKPITLVNIDGVFDLTTPKGNIFWGWSNTSPKVAYGVQSDTNTDTVALTEAVTALYIHSRNKVDASLAPIDDKETKALRDLLGETSSAAVESRVLAKYPTVEKAIAGLTDQALTVTQKPETTGGIDSNPDLVELQIMRDGNGVALPLPMQPVDTLRNIDGFIPVIIQMTPITNLPLILGIAPDTDSQKIGYDADLQGTDPRARLQDADDGMDYL
ncbi:MAG: UTP--glucose-1-phosphate uridylyltransferase [Candidatus Omnitrophica bacterium]|nr:UTP--glucose-1-phosphate uridylyltransferase [Candidatus Omnitrophota bacterium]